MPLQDAQQYAAATLTHDIEKSFQKQEILIALAFDIKGAFDRIMDYRFIQRLVS